MKERGDSTPPVGEIEVTGAMSIGDKLVKSISPEVEPKKDMPEIRRADLAVNIIEAALDTIQRAVEISKSKTPYIDEDTRSDRYGGNYSESVAAGAQLAEYTLRSYQKMLKKFPKEMTDLHLREGDQDDRGRVLLSFARLTKDSPSFAFLSSWDVIFDYLRKRVATAEQLTPTHVDQIIEDISYAGWCVERGKSEEANQGASKGDMDVYYRDKVHLMALRDALEVLKAEELDHAWQARPDEKNFDVGEKRGRLSFSRRFDDPRLGPRL